MVTLSDFQRIGVGLVGFGIFFILFGMLLYFDSVLLAFGNILFLSGLVFIIGFRRTFTFFFQRQKMKGSSFFLGGVLIVLMRWPLLGMLLEAYGFITLFRSLHSVTVGWITSQVGQHEWALSPAGGWRWLCCRDGASQAAPGRLCNYYYYYCCCC
uniref:Golgi transport 1A n=1 Tax=Pavo cristatus TaxID=9049 RepID=A0A8C9EMN4_PAVCR